MGIADATSHLALTLIKCIHGHEEEAKLIPLLEAIAAVRDFRDRNNLAGWELHVLRQLSDSDWHTVENSNGFVLLESIWEISRSSLFGAIDSQSSSRFYREASTALREQFGLITSPHEDFDFSSW